MQKKHNYSEALLLVETSGRRFYYAQKTERKRRMDFEEFKEQIAKDLKEVLYSRYGMDASVEQRTVEKFNSAYDALTVKPEDCEIGVSMNLDTLYDACRNGEAYDVVLNKAAELADGREIIKTF